MDVCGVIMMPFYRDFRVFKRINKVFRDFTHTYSK